MNPVLGVVAVQKVIYSETCLESNEDKVSDDKARAKAYLKGYEQGLRDAWSDLIGLTTKGYRGREIQILAKSKMAGISKKLDDRRRLIEEEMGISLEEQTVPSAEESDTILPGSAYLVEYTHPSRDLEIFGDLMASGMRGMCVHRVDPGRIGERFGDDCTIVWLTKTELPGSSSKEICSQEFKCVSPAGLDQLTTMIIEFLRDHPTSVILIGGLEYLLTYNEFVKVLRFLQTLKDRVILTDSILLVPYDPSTMDPKDVKNLEREMERRL